MNTELRTHRLVPLLCWLVVALAALFIPLKIISYGGSPSGDARRHVAKALTDKEYDQIVVLRPEYKIDHSPGWDWLLHRVRHLTNWDEDALMGFSVAALLLCVLAIPLPFLRRPEAWLAAVLVQQIALPDLMLRLTQGRPYLITETVLICILFAWTGGRGRNPSWQKIVLTLAGFTLSVWMHGAWYLWVVVLGAFFMAGAWTEMFWLAACWIGGVVIGALLTGKPVAFLYGAVYMAASVGREHVFSWMLVGEFQPSDGEFYSLAILALVYLWTLVRKKNSSGLMRDPLFWLIAACWTLGFKADRFWADWGLPAATVWLAMRFDDFLAESWPAESCRRFLACALIAAPLYLDSTSDLHVRYTHSFDEAFVDGSDPALKEWMPGDGGIFYSAEMAFFYNTYYKNPYANWRYIIGFEPALMPGEDLKIFHAIQMSHYDWRSYGPWIKKMRPQDRLEIPGSVQPDIPELEWRQAARGIWIGRPPVKK